MAIVTTDNKHYSDIAEVIRYNISPDHTYKPDEMANAINEGFSTVHGWGKSEGYSEGYTVGHDEGVTQGMANGIQAEYDRFWDIYQANGSRISYLYAFCSAGWNVNSFKPKYDMQPTSASGIFYNSYIKGDLVEILENLGITLDFSKATKSMNSAFANTDFTRLGVIDVSSVIDGGLGQLFSGSSGLHTIDMFIVNENQIYTNTFANTSSLKNITFGGTVGKTLDMKSCPLSVASMKSVISHLKNYAGTSSDGTYTIKFNDACWTALEADSTAPDGGTWKDYVQLSLGWAV